MPLYTTDVFGPYARLGDSETESLTKNSAPSTQSLDEQATLSLGTGSPAIWKNAFWSHSLSHQDPQTPSTPSPIRRATPRSVARRMRSIQIPSRARPLGLYLNASSDVLLLSPTTNARASTVSLGHAPGSPARRTPTRARIASGPAAASLRRKVKGGADGGLRAMKAAGRGATPSPKRKRGGIAAALGVGALVRSVKSFAHFGGKERGRRRPAPGSDDMCMNASGASPPSSRRQAGLKFYPAPAVYAGTVDDDDSDEQMDGDAHHESPIPNPFASDTSSEDVSLTEMLSTSPSIYRDAGAERVPNPAERRTTGSGGGRNKLIGVLGAEVRAVVEAPVMDICPSQPLEPVD